MFVIAGKNDPRVPVTESQQTADALKKEGTPVWLPTTVLLENGSEFAAHRYGHTRTLLIRVG